MSLPQIIFLNGASCAGKTSIARGLQAQLPVPFARLGVDDFVFPLSPPRWHGVPEGIQFQPTEDGGYRLHIGEGGMAMQRAFHRAARAIVDSGLGLVVDDVLLDPRLLEDWLKVLDGLDVFWVGVRCALDELERRERLRPDRAKGHARTHAGSVHAGVDYDLTVDTTATPTDQCVRRIVEALETAGVKTNAGSGTWPG